MQSFLRGYFGAVAGGGGVIRVDVRFAAVAQNQFRGEYDFAAVLYVDRHWHARQLLPMQREESAFGPVGEFAVPEVGAGDGATDIPDADAVTDQGRGIVGRDQMAEQ
jgi:hypothetical protein